VWLVGMMGAGKSTIGRRLAQRLGRRFVDTDAEVERAVGRSVAEIFAHEGEAAFRGHERAAIEAVGEEAAVVALGGGAIAQPGASERLARAGTVVYLRARPATLLARVGDAEGRPLLRGLAAERQLARLAELLEERRKAYESARIVLDTDDRPVAALVEELARRLAGDAP
jgi:shikimate kinase